MANHYFQFKEFTVYQDMSAMKVCTDACLFGAYTADLIIKENITVANCLDIGTGTGLLSLMLAQQLDCTIDAVEIDNRSYRQAAGNFRHSPWNSRLAVFNTDIKAYQSEKKYDCIISNPPFFEGDLKSEEQSKNAAKHDSTLTLVELLEKVLGLLSDDGIFAVLLPYKRVKYFIEEAEKQGLHLFHRAMVKQTPLHSQFRGMLYFSRKQVEPSKKEIAIKNEMGDYTARFIELLKDYYLYLQ